MMQRNSVTASESLFCVRVVRGVLVFCVLSCLWRVMCGV